MNNQDVEKYLEKFNLDDKIINLNSSSATAKLAAEAIGCSEGQIAKSISFYDNNSGAVLIVVSGDAKIDNKKYKGYFGFKAKMLKFEDVEKYIGYKVGGVCPFNINENCKVYLDISLKKYDVVYLAAGSDNSVVKLSLEELERTSNFIEWIDVCL